MPSVPVEPRPLSSSERAVLEHVLSVEFDGASAPRSQLEHTEVVATWAVRSSSVDLRVHGRVRRAAMTSELVPVEARILDESGDYVGELLVWTAGGAVLAAIEHVWVTDEMPTSLPPVDRVQLRAR